MFAFKVDGTSQRFNLSKGDGFLRPQNGEGGLPGELGERGLWQVCDLDGTTWTARGPHDGGQQVCDLDGTTGDIKVAGAGGIRKVLEFNGPVDQPGAATVAMQYVQVQSFLATPAATQMTVALWLKLDARAGLGLGTVLSYSTAASPTTFNINNVKALQICAGGECGVTTDVSLVADSEAAGTDSPGWIHVAVTWDAAAPANPSSRPGPGCLTCTSAPVRAACQCCTDPHRLRALQATARSTSAARRSGRAPWALARRSAPGGRWCWAMFRRCRGRCPGAQRRRLWAGWPTSASGARPSPPSTYRCVAATALGLVRACGGAYCDALRGCRGGRSGCSSRTRRGRRRAWWPTSA